MNLVAGVKRVVGVMEIEVGGQLELLGECTLPLVGRGGGGSLLIEIGVLSNSGGGEVGVGLIELADGLPLDEISAKTEAWFGARTEKMQNE